MDQRSWSRLLDCQLVGTRTLSDVVAQKVFELLPKYGFKATILIEPYLGGDPNRYNQSWWNQTITYIKQHYIEKYPEAYFYLNGKPLIIAFNPIGMKYNPSADFPSFTIRIVGNGVDGSGYKDWDLWPDYDKELTGELRLNEMFGIFIMFLVIAIIYLIRATGSSRINS